MKFTLLSIGILLCTFSAKAQTNVFKKNKEIAVLNQRAQISAIVLHTFQFETFISEDEFHLISQLMEEKKGFVSLQRISEHQLLVEHENWVQLNDIQSVIKAIHPKEGIVIE